MTRNRRLIDKGADVPYQGLVDQTRVLIKLGSAHAEPLNNHNWTPAKNAALDAKLAKLDTEQARKVDERAGARKTTRDEGDATTEAKALILRVRNVAPQVIRQNPDAGVTLDDLEAGTKLGRSTGKISAYLGKLGPYALKLDDAFAAYLGGKKLSELLGQAKQKVDDTSSTQVVDYASLPDDTAAVLELKGEVLESIEDLIAIARNAFANEPEIRNAFNKDIIAKARKSRPKKDDKPT